MGTIKAFFAAIAAIWTGKNAAEKRANTPEMRANAKAKTDAKIKDEARKFAKESTLEEKRRKLR